MKIAMISPINYPTPPPKYGGTEQVVYYLTEELVKRGHEVTLFATADSKTSAKLVSVFPKPVSKFSFYKPSGGSIFLSLNAVQAFEKASDFDIIHNHVGRSGIIFNQLTKTPLINTHHGMFSETDRIVYQRYLKKIYFTALSEAQKSWFPELNFIDTVYSGVDVEEFPLNLKPKDYFLFLSNIWPGKGPHLAIAVAKKTKKKLVIAGYLSETWKDYFNKEIKPHIDGEKIIYLGGVSFKKKLELYKNAQSLLFPINWQDAWPLVPIEAMACGTPVITFDCASMPEMIINNKTGFIVNDIEEMIKAVGKINQIDRRQCRKHVEEKFTAQKMTDEYEKVYQKIIKSKF